MTANEIKTALNRRVLFTNRKLYAENAEYILTGVVFRRGERGFYWQAELTDINVRNSVIYCGLKEVEVKK